MSKAKKSNVEIKKAPIIGAGKTLSAYQTSKLSASKFEITPTIKKK